jgi:hypothetical protein
MENTKSREIPITDLFHNLQLEWISYFIRSQIYERKIDLKMFSDIIRMKKEKIDTFSLRNSIPSIFSKSEKLEKYLNEFYPKDNKLNFEYTPKNRGWLTHWDKHYFYIFDTIVDYEGAEVKIIKNDTHSSKVEFLTPQREHKRVSYSEVRRDIKILFD